MPRVLGRNKHQKAAHKIGEQQVSREQIAELLEMSHSSDAEERLCAAKYMCPCHIKGRISEVWEALYRMMEDADPRVRFAAWHTLEDGGLPDDPETFARLERLYRKEKDKKVRHIAEQSIGREILARREKEMTLLHLAARPAVKRRGKCDFCGETDVFVDYQLDTMIPAAGELPRAALICEKCRQ